MNCRLGSLWTSAAAVAVLGLLPLRAADPSGGQSTFAQHRIGKAVVSLPSHWTSLPPEIPVWLHLHGAPAAIEAGFASMEAPGAIVNVTLPGLSKAYADHFAEPKVLPELLSETEALLRRLDANSSRRLGALTVSSFSAGFGGVRQLLRQPEAFARITTLVMADSIYCGYAGDVAKKQVDEELMAGFLRFARLAAEGRKRFLISHSRQVPVGYASTTETADYLIGQLQGSRAATEAGTWPGGLRLLTGFSRGGFEVLGFDGDAPEDHMRHLRSIGALWKRARETP
jgi:hypothetical protein